MQEGGEQGGSQVEAVEKARWSEVVFLRFCKWKIVALGHSWPMAMAGPAGQMT